MIILGQEVKDKISGFKGIATCRAIYLNGCVRIEITSKKMEKGKPIEAWFDETQVKVVGEGLNKKKTRAPGGPRYTQPQRDDPR